MKVGDLLILGVVGVVAYILIQNQVAKAISSSFSLGPLPVPLTTIQSSAYYA